MTSCGTTPGVGILEDETWSTLNSLNYPSRCPERDAVGRKSTSADAVKKHVIQGEE